MQVKQPLSPALKHVSQTLSQSLQSLALELAKPEVKVGSGRLTLTLTLSFSPHKPMTLTLTLRFNLIQEADLRLKPPHDKGYLFSLNNYIIGIWEFS